MPSSPSCLSSFIPYSDTSISFTVSLSQWMSILARVQDQVDKYSQFGACPKYGEVSTFDQCAAQDMILDGCFCGVSYPVTFSFYPGIHLGDLSVQMPLLYPLIYGCHRLHPVQTRFTVFGVYRFVNSRREAENVAWHKSCSLSQLLHSSVTGTLSRVYDLYFNWAELWLC